MPYLKDLNHYLFLHIPKTAGTSIEDYLFLNRNDVFKWDKYKDRNYLNHNFNGIKKSFLKRSLLYDKINNIAMLGFAPQHMCYKDYETIFKKNKLYIEEFKHKLISKRANLIVENYTYTVNDFLKIDDSLNYFDLQHCFKFACMRNPYTRLVSSWLSSNYYRDGQENNKKNFNKWIKNIYIKDTILRKQESESKMFNTNVYKKYINRNIYDYYLSDSTNNIKADFLIKYEDINDVFNGKLPVKNITKNSNKLRFSDINNEYLIQKEKKYLSYYDSESKKIFESLNEKDINIYENFLIKYKFVNFKDAYYLYNKNRRK